MKWVWAIAHPPAAGAGRISPGKGVPTTMRINTSRFGRIDIETADLIRFPSGLPGLEDCREWALLADSTNDALGWLQSTTRGDVALAVVSPRRFVPDYQVRIPRSELTPLAIADIRQAQVVVVVGTNDKASRSISRLQSLSTSKPAPAVKSLRAASFPCNLNSPPAELP